MQKTQNLQDSFLNQVRKDKLMVTMFLMDCLWVEKIYGSINIAQIDDGATTPEYADRLRRKYLWGEDI